MKLLKQYGLALLSVFFAFAYANAQSGSIKIGQVSGSVTVVNGTSGSSTAAVADSIYSPPLTVITDGDGDVLLFLSNGAVIEVKPGSRVEISHFSQEPFDILDPFQSVSAEPSSSQVSVRVISGQIAVKVPSLNPNSTFVVSTPTNDIIANDAVTVVSYDSQTAATQVSNVGGNGTVSVESSAPGSQPTSVPSGQTLTAPGQLDPTTGAASSSGEPTLAPASPADNQAGEQVSNPPVPAPQNPAQPTTPPTPPSTTPELDLPDLINPTSTEPAPV